MEIETPSTSVENGRERNEERKNRLLSNYHLDEDQWNKVGFWCAIHNAPKPDKAFEILTKDYQVFHNDQQDQLKKNHETELDRFENKIDRAKARIQLLRSELESHKDTTELGKEILQEKEAINEVEGELIGLYRKLGTAKTNLVQDQIKEVFRDLESITDKYDQISEKLNGLSDKAKQRNSEALGIKPNLLKGLSENYQEVLAGLKNRFAFLNKSAAAYFGRSKLIGYGAAVAAGWFFSVYALGRQISNEDVPFFLITGLFSFGNALKMGGFTTSLLNHVAFVLIILASVFTLSGVCFILLDKLEKRAIFSRVFFNLLLGGGSSGSDEDETGQPNVKQSDNEFDLPAGSQSSKAFFSFWIEALPFLLILGIIFIVLSMGNVDDQRFNSLSVSLSAQAVGVAVAMGLAGLAYLYITNIIEPRLEQQRSADGEPKWLILNIELVIVLAFLTLLIVVVLFGVNNTLYLSTNDVFSFIMFIICTLISSVTLGYGVYYSGLSQTAAELEAKIHYLAIGTAYNTFPNIRMIIRADNVFRRAHLQLVQRLLNLEIRKTKLAEKFFVYESNIAGQREQQRFDSRKKRKSERLWTRIRHFFYPPVVDNDLFSAENLSQEERIEAELAQIDDRFETVFEDKEYFPELTCEIENSKGRLHGRVRRLIELETDVRNRYEERTPLAKRYREEMADLDEKISNWGKYISVLLDIQLNEMNSLYEVQKRNFSRLQDGFNLGRWFTVGNILPTENPLGKEVTNGEFIRKPS